MADKKITELTELSTIADGDFLYILDVSDITDSSDGTSKKIQKQNLVAGLTLSDLSDVTASVADVNATTNFEETLSSTTSVLTVSDGAIDFDVASHDGTNGLKLGGTLVTSTATELNKLDGLSGDVVGTTDTQTLTNKTITDSSNSFPSASTSAAGDVELATAAETTTGTDSTRALTPDGLSGSDYGKRVVQVVLLDNDTDTTVVDGVGSFYFTVPPEMNGYNLVDADASVGTAGTTGTTDIQIYNITQTTDMLDTKITIDSGETSSYTAATPPVIDTANDDVATGDQIRFDVDAVATTAAKGLTVIMSFQNP